MADGDTTPTLTMVKNFKKTIQQANGYEIITANWSGEYDVLRTKSLAYPIGFWSKISNEDFSEANYGFVVMANTLTRREGNLADLSISVSHTTSADKNWFCSLDMVAVPKDIRTWKPTGEGEEAPNLTQIQYWEGAKQNEPNLYAQYQYREPPPSGSPEGTLGEIKTLEGNTKTLAEMIFQGVNTYTIHAPCLTVISYYTALAEPYNTRIDHQVETSKLAARLKLFAIGDIEWDKLIENMADVWIQTDYKLTTQANGLSQLTIRWIGATDAREELYPKESAGEE